MRSHLLLILLVAISLALLLAGWSWDDGMRAASWVS